VGAVVLRVETGGGSAMAADVIYREIQLTTAIKPVIVSMGSAAASGAAIEDANLTLVPDNFRLMMEMESAERRCTVVWRQPTRIGVRFS